MAFAVLLAAGSSTRFGRDKLRLVISGRPLWRLSFDTLANHPEVDGVGIVCREGCEQEFEGAGADFVIPGGKTRAESSLAGVSATPTGAEIVLVHDGARPFLPLGVVSRVISAAKEFGAGIPALPVADTVKRGAEWVEKTVPRAGLFLAQTPQAARRDWLIAALSAAPDATDEAMALENAGRRVRIVEGHAQNIKVTTKADLAARTVSVTGFGYDVHAFSEDATRKLMLGGVHFPEGRGLHGHSDADVLLHAVTDAILGACGLGDIGQIFPDTDAEWRGADSLIFLREAVRRAREAGGRPAALDVTVLAEAPRLGEKRSEIRAILARELGVQESNTNVKATTAERLGAIGRGEGIAAMAVATVLRPIYEEV
ncbi:MAG TPA: 2-C-methyl-D-erythritol 4-phosphate cytidylyltransferase [Fimbriimonadales bacterium]|jgi:2-C-methyl-D-erythritol 4-phosphate cytidylyltransferase/2-C-methyl-D-erythritol 2,4-cyclodiphosphate synthase|nr:2-C-methyl-D-erythritol 4-phosphate cytidylyltransferase [Fimbriimonadales bacterium]